MQAYARFAVFLVASSILLAAHAAAPDADQRDLLKPQQDAQVKPLIPKLEYIVETRKLDVTGNGDGQRPELLLSFSLDLPRGSGITKIVQPKNFRAVDDQGNDLTKVPMRPFSPQREWLDSVSFDDAPELGVRIVPPPRDAKSISVAFDAELIVYSGIDMVDIKCEPKWTPLDHPAFKAMNAEYRITDNDEFEIRPVEAKESIRAVIALVLKTEHITTPRGSSIRWGEASARYDLFPGYAEEDRVPVAGQRVRMWVYADAASIPIRVDIKDQKLP